MARSMAYDPRHGLRPAAWPMTRSLAYDPRHGLRPAAWPMTRSMAYDPRHGLRPCRRVVLARCAAAGGGADSHAMYLWPI